MARDKWGWREPVSGYVVDGETLCPSCTPAGEEWRAYALRGVFPRWVEVRQCERCGEMLPELKKKRGLGHAIRAGGHGR